MTHAIEPVDIRTADKLGITLWRLRPEQKGDAGARLLTMNASKSGSTKMVAERVGLDATFRMGEKVRLSIESPRAGYLYIIDRELHKDDTTGEPYLIFPTLRTRGGDNSVLAGKVIEIPAQTDSQTYFDITPTDDNYAGELLTAIVSPTKIDGLRITEDPLKLTTAQVEGWENLWERVATTFELDAGKDLMYTEEEKEAGNGTRLLTQKSPAPQSLIAVQAPKGKAFMVSIPLKVSQ